MTWANKPAAGKPGIASRFAIEHHRPGLPEPTFGVVTLMATDLIPNIWNVLHDGTIVEATGIVPGDVRLSIAIDYLRRRFPDAGQYLILTLHDCTCLAYEPDEPKGGITNLEAIGAAEPEILKAEDWTDANKVYCVSGTLRVVARAFSLALDSGRSITLQELMDVSEAYWTEWEERAKEARGNTP